MKTTDLIEALAKDAGPVRPERIAFWLALAALTGAAISFAGLIAGYGMPSVTENWRFMKLAYTALLGTVAVIGAVRLSRPGGKAGLIVLLGGGAVVAWLAGMAGMETMRTPAADQTALWMGQTWNVCAMRIVALGVPTFALGLWAMRAMAPTRPALAGAAVGLLAGAVGATDYGLYCMEHTAAFVVVWYTLGLAASAAIGALIGRWLLRW